METILENIIGVIEAVWLKLATLLNLEGMIILDSLKPVLANILSDPLLLGLALAVIAIIPYTIYKVKNAYAEKEKRLDALLRELDDEGNSEEADTILLENQNTKDFSPEEPANESDSKAYGDEFESQSSEKVTVPSGDLNRTPQEIFKNRRISDDDFGWETSVEEWDELYDYISKPFQTDKQTAVSSSNEALSGSKDKVSTEPVPKEEIAEVSSGIDKLADQIIKEAISNDETAEESSNMGIDELAELIEENETALDTDQTNKTLAQGEEVTVGIDPTIESTSEESSNIGIDELAELIEEEELSDSQVEASTGSVPSTTETKPLEFNEATDSLSEPETISLSPVPQRVELTLEDVESSNEPKPELQTISTESPSRPDSEAPSAGPLLNSMLNSSVSAKTDALVSRLKTFQSELETRFQSLAQEPETTAEVTPTETLRKKQGNYQPAKVSYKSKRKSRSNKEYLRQLESFIFMARQKSKNTDA